MAYGSTPAVPGTRLTVTYDGLSRRIAKKVEQQNAVTLIRTVVEYQGYLYDAWNCIMCVRLKNDATATTPPTVRGRLASYVWGPDIGSSSRQGANWQAAGGVGGLLFVSQGTNVDTSYTGTPAYDAFYADSYFPLWDRMGNITGYRKASTSTTDSALATTGAMIDYDAFGREIRSSGPAADKIPIHFSSKFTDMETGLNYYGYRYYDPVNGRWLGRDPIGEEGGVNLFGSVENNALRSIDILGLAISKEQGAKTLRALAGKMKLMCEKCCPDNLEACKDDAQRITDALVSTWNGNYGDGPWDHPHAVGRYLCWDWSRVFKRAADRIDSKTWNSKENMWLDLSHPGLVHHALRLQPTCCGEKEECTIFVDDGWGPPADETVHPAPWPGLPYSEGTSWPEENKYARPAPEPALPGRPVP
jgi:RHS repeat-associated protein